MVTIPGLLCRETYQIPNGHLLVARVCELETSEGNTAFSAFRGH